MSDLIKPTDYQPPYPAYTGRQPTGRPDVVLAMFAVQARNGADASATTAQVRALLNVSGAGAPLHFDESRYVDVQGALNVLLMPYWAHKEDQAAFWAREDVAAFVAAPAGGEVGWWIESLHAPTTSLDANYATPDIRYGIGRHSEMKVEQHHAYMGSMRHRVPDYFEGSADAPPRQLARLAPLPESLGNTLHIRELPGKLCFIRGGFAWKDAEAQEQVAYMRDMLPVYREGAHYLRDNPIESNCISMRMTDEQAQDVDNGVQSNAIGWFLSLKDLERWTRSHPRHLAIMKTIMEYMARFDFKPKLNLGHEVIVVPQGQLTCIYANCHNETGFLPYYR